MYSYICVFMCAYIFISIYTHTHTLWNFPIDMKKTDNDREKELFKEEIL